MHNTIFNAYAKCVLFCIIKLTDVGATSISNVMPGTAAVHPQDTFTCHMGREQFLSGSQ